MHLLRRLLLEQLLRKRVSSDYERYVESFRRCAVDPNPHQLEAVAFALRRLPEGGAMLCDEVGLGKTIEAGLILTQLRAERRGHILVVVPLPLARQWQVELKDLFGLSARPLNKAQLGDTPGIYIVGREFAGSPTWAPEIAKRGPWDLVVVDEAHEGLSSIHQRFGKAGGYLSNPAKGKARRAAFLKTIIGDAPVLLLTATPIQNTLYELWSLVHFVDPKNTVLGSFHEFSRLFAVKEGRNVREEMQSELRQRLRLVICRTLRAEAQPFLKTPFTQRRCETINFHMQSLERALYDAVSEWLQERISIYDSTQKRLVTTTLRRRMGSSVNALARTLTLMRERLENGEIATKATPDQVERDIAELRRLEELAARALAGPAPKLEKLTEFIRRLDADQVEGVTADKLVIFTESVRTLQTLVRHLEETLGLAGQVTAFSGQNETAAAAAALARWEEEVGRFLDPGQRPDRSSAVRAALVHEFKTRTRILVATEAGAKGLNLQFCNCLVNYDLPWNPQRIEQRIGRVHRYGQKHDVVIVNFINLDNEGEQRVYKLLNEKLRLFEGLLGASDTVLGDISSVLDFEARVVELLSNCRTEAERQREFSRLELEIDEETRKRREARRGAAESVLAQLDPDVQARLTQAAAEIPAALSQRDQTLLRLLELEAPLTPVVQDVWEWKGRRVHVGPPRPGAEYGEPLTLALVGAERTDEVESWWFAGSPPAAWEVHRVTVEGLEVEEHVVVLGGADLQEVLESGPRDLRPAPAWEPSPDLEEVCARIQRDAEAAQAPYLQRLLRLCAARREDLRRSLDQEEAELREAVQKALKARVVARTPQQSGLALVEHRKAEEALQAFLGSREERWRETLAQLAAQERSVGERRFARVSSVPLFRLERREA